MKREQRTYSNHTNRKNIRRRKKSGNSFSGRFTTFFAVILLIMVCSFGFSSFFSSAHDSLSNAPMDIKYYKSIQVESGDSVWSIAEKYMGDKYNSIYDYMDELVSLNQMDTSELDNIQEGDYLMVAYYDTAQ